MNNTNIENEKVNIPITEKYLLNVIEVMEYTGLGRDRVYQLMRSGRLKTIKIGRYNKIHRLELEKFLDRAAEENIVL
ncbi:helix-turn-helix domain-containing protein [Gudongella sp. DL1XJH-153]|uniref:helix-turn-helix domain-containing protein n=1 Tax=Gudongella sp. DL1XJH-153 TaxID=3409804 RepID=UPI003BB75D8A